MASPFVRARSGAREVLRTNNLPSGRRGVGPPWFRGVRPLGRARNARVLADRRASQRVGVIGAPLAGDGRSGDGHGRRTGSDRRRVDAAMIALEAAAQVAARLRWLVLAGVATAPVAIILGWRAVALVRPVPQLFQVLDAVVILASLAVLVGGHRLLRPRDVGLTVAVGALLGWLVPHTGFYPLLAWTVAGAADGIVALMHGTGVAIALLGGIVAARRGGPVRLRAASGAWRASLTSLGIGAAIELPLAAVNAYANTLVQGRPFVWQGLGFPLVEALEPGFVEEIVYRFALLGIVWLLLRPSWGRRAPWLAGGIALLVHTFAHNGELLLTNPLMFLGFGTVLALVWGVPTTILALRRDLESAAGLHWVRTRCGSSVGCDAR
jgi:hypothetical protein